MQHEKLHRSDIETRLYEGHELDQHLPRLQQFVNEQGQLTPSSRLVWLKILQAGLKQRPYLLEAVRAGRAVGLLPLMFVESLLFGRFLVGMPYLNSGGVVAVDAAAATALIDRAVALADALRVKHLELRHERGRRHPAFNYEAGGKLHMRLDLPRSADELWSQFDPKVRNQIRKGEKSGLTVAWGGLERVDDFYRVFSRNMRDLGTPVFSRELFRQMLLQFKADAEICLLYRERQPVSGAVLLHGVGVTEVPSASTLRKFNSTNANMLMYWRLLQRAIARGQHTFDFGRSSEGSNTYRFKKQWGAHPEPALWQYYVRSGNVAAMRPDSPRNQRLIQLWKRLPPPLANWLGPPIVRGIP